MRLQTGAGSPALSKSELTERGWADVSTCVPLKPQLTPAHINICCCSYKNSACNHWAAYSGRSRPGETSGAPRFLHLMSHHTTAHYSILPSSLRSVDYRFPFLKSDMKTMAESQLSDVLPRSLCLYIRNDFYTNTYNIYTSYQFITHIRFKRFDDFI